ncbi:Imm31 family immunity protein, partial [uncultured Gimesia sp.]|jgi:hypothetical protein|uniref:Imm31 family immunity protein n=1 Tax=uncultured Gimesia sp. TaxID=1678688 RepID=UPI00260F553C
MQHQFQFYEVVVVVENEDDNLQAVAGQEGTILGMSQNEESGHWGYAVSMTDTGIVCSIDESYLKSTGKIQRRSDFYSGDSVKVQVDPNTGEGSLKKDV